MAIKVDVAYDSNGNIINYKAPTGEVIAANSLPAGYEVASRYNASGVRVPGGVNMDGAAILGDSAAGNFANVTRANWYDYENRFAPKENELIALSSDENFIKLGEDMAEQGINRAALRGLSDLNINNARKGVTLKADEQAAVGRRAAVGLAAAKSQAVNTARVHGQDRQMAILGGGLSTALKKQQGA